MFFIFIFYFFLFIYIYDYKDITIFFLWQVQVQSIPAASFIAFRPVFRVAPVVAPELGLLDRASLALNNVFRREPSPPPQAQVKSNFIMLMPIFCKVSSILTIVSCIIFF
jgi:hypothetical protein